MPARVRVLDRQQFALGIVFWIASGTAAVVVGVLGGIGFIFASRPPGVLIAIGGAVWLAIGIGGAWRSLRS